MDLQDFRLDVIQLPCKLLLFAFITLDADKLSLFLGLNVLGCQSVKLPNDFFKNFSPVSSCLLPPLSFLLFSFFFVK